MTLTPTTLTCVDILTIWSVVGGSGVSPYVLVWVATGLNAEFLSFYLCPNHRVFNRLLLPSYKLACFNILYVSCLQSSCTIATSSSLAKSGYGDTSLDPHQDGAEQVTVGQSLITGHLVPRPEAS